MRKITFSNLEQARMNPSKYGNAMKSGTLISNSFGGYPKSVRWLDAAVVYHETGELSRAITKLEQSFSGRKNTLKNQREVEDLIFSLSNYVDEHKARNYVHFDKRITMSVIYSSIVKISGWIWLLNIKPDGGYAGYIISKSVDEIDWESELRFPIMQSYVANTLYGCKLEDVDVGIIDFQTGQHYSTCYSDKDIEEAVEEFNDIGTTLSEILNET